MTEDGVASQIPNGMTQHESGGEEWPAFPDRKAKKRIQNRVAQRSYREFSDAQIYPSCLPLLISLVRTTYEGSSARTRGKSESP